LVVRKAHHHSNGIGTPDCDQHQRMEARALGPTNERTGWGSENGQVQWSGEPNKVRWAERRSTEEQTTSRVALDDRPLPRDTVTLDVRHAKHHHTLAPRPHHKTGRNRDRASHQRQAIATLGQPER
jgi:hypothetical protein